MVKPCTGRREVQMPTQVRFWAKLQSIIYCTVQLWQKTGKPNKTRLALQLPNNDWLFLSNYCIKLEITVMFNANSIILLISCEKNVKYPGRMVQGSIRLYIRACFLSYRADGILTNRHIICKTITFFAPSICLWWVSHLRHKVFVDISTW